MYRHDDEYTQTSGRDRDEYCYKSRASSNRRNEPKSKRREYRDDHDDSRRRVNRYRNEHDKYRYESCRNEDCDGDVRCVTYYNEPRGRDKIGYKGGNDYDLYDDRDDWRNEEKVWHDRDKKVKGTVHTEEARHDRDYSRSEQMIDFDDSYYEDHSQVSQSRDRYTLQSKYPSEERIDNFSRSPLNSREHSNRKECKTSPNHHSGENKRDDESRISSRSRHSRKDKTEEISSEMILKRNRLDIIHERDTKPLKAVSPPIEVRIRQQNDGASSKRREESKRHGEQSRRNCDDDLRSLRGNNKHEKEMSEDYFDSNRSSSKTCNSHSKNIDTRSSSSSKSKGLAFFNFFKRSSSPQESCDKVIKKDGKRQQYYDGDYNYQRSNKGDVLHVSTRLSRDKLKDSYHNSTNERYHKTKTNDDSIVKATRTDVPPSVISGKKQYKDDKLSRYILNEQENSDSSDDKYEMNSTSRNKKSKHLSRMKYEDSFEYESENDVSSRRSNYSPRKQFVLFDGCNHDLRSPTIRIDRQHDERSYSYARRRDPGLLSKSKHEKSHYDSIYGVTNQMVKSQISSFSDDEDSLSSRSVEMRLHQSPLSRRRHRSDNQNISNENKHAIKSTKKGNERKTSIEKLRHKKEYRNEVLSKDEIPKSALCMAVLQDIKKGDAALKNIKLDQNPMKGDILTQIKNGYKLNSVPRDPSQKPNKPTTILDEIKSGTKTLKKVNPSSPNRKPDPSDTTLDVIKARRKLLENQKNMSFE